jgi:hypothetical protein
VRQGKGLLNPVFDSHLRVPMAGGRTPEMCAGLWKSVEPRQVALAGFLVNSLVEDMRRGEAVFEVKLTVMEDAQHWKIHRRHLEDPVH